MLVCLKLECFECGCEKQGAGLDINICKMQKSTEIFWIFANQFWWSHVFASSLTEEAKKLLLSLFHFPRMGFLSWKPRSPRQLCRSDLSPSRCACSPFLSSLCNDPSFETSTSPRGDHSLQSALSLYFLTYLPFPHYRQHQWLEKSGEQQRRFILSTRRNGPNSPEIPAPFSALCWQPSPSFISHGSPGSASALAFRL